MHGHAWTRRCFSSILPYFESLLLLCFADCILAHNKYRVGKLKHPLMPSERNSDAVYQALKFAKELMEGACEFKHSKASGVREE